MVECCSSFQLTSILIMCGSTLLYSFLWTTVILAPLKLTIVCQHELCHAIAALLTCGKVKGISISSNFGGVTTTVGGNRCVTLTAGYIGSVMFGCLYILLAVDNKNANYAGVAIYLFSCLISFFILKTDKASIGNCCTGLGLRLSILIVMGAFVGLWILEQQEVWPEKYVMSWGLLVVGTGNVLFALFECVEDTFLNKVNDAERGKSDAVMLAEEVCGSARCWGLIWSAICLGCIGGTIYAFLVLSGN